MKNEPESRPWRTAHGTRWMVAVGLAMALAAGATAAPPQQHVRIQLRHVTNVTGIQFRHTDGSCGKRYIIENMTAGLALLDYDLDGDIDIYFLNGGAHPGLASRRHAAPQPVVPQ